MRLYDQSGDTSAFILRFGGLSRQHLPGNALLRLDLKYS